MRRLAVLLLVAAAMFVTAQGASAKASCDFDHLEGGSEFVMDCVVRVASKTVITWERDITTLCYGFRHWYAEDRSKRVEIAADGHWIAPRVARMRAYGTSLGPLRVIGRITRSGHLRVSNRSRFPIAVTFRMTCDSDNL